MVVVAVVVARAVMVTSRPRPQTSPPKAPPCSAEEHRAPVAPLAAAAARLNMVRGQTAATAERHQRPGRRRRLTLAQEQAAEAGANLTVATVH